ncbi:efflux RND transporter permease subunit, partial [Pseudacidovorax intermedius]
LIVEFAKDLHARGASLMESALEAARLRLRPILMTSLAFILGVLPLVFGHGAGAGAQNALGTAVVGGMVSGTVLAILFVPLFFVVVLRAVERRGPRHPSSEPVAGTLPAEGA